MDKINFYHCERLKRSIFWMVWMDLFQINFFLPKIKFLIYFLSFLIPECVASLFGHFKSLGYISFNQSNFSSIFLYF